VGYRDGNLDVLSFGSDSGGSEPRQLTFERVPSSEVLRIAYGPKKTVIAGYANGLVAIWDGTDGTLLRRSQLHGPVVHLRLVDERLYAATELGQHLVWNLSALYSDYCELLRQVWQQVPVVWRGGRAELASPPSKHICAGRM